MAAFFICNGKFLHRRIERSGDPFRARDCSIGKRQNRRPSGEKVNLDHVANDEHRNVSVTR
jgi:hypothetical protein